MASLPKPQESRTILLLGLLTLLQVVNSVAAIRVDGCVMVPDGADFYDWSSQIALEIREGNLRQALGLMWGNPQRGPLAIIPAAVTQAILGVSADAAQASSLLWYVLLIIIIYRIGRLLHSPGAGLLAAAAVSATPQILGFSRLLWLDLPLTVATALAIWMLLRTRNFSRLGPSLAFGVAVGLGLLMKPSQPIYILFPAAGCLAVALGQPGQRWRALGRAALSAAVALAVFALWAAFHLQMVLRAFWMARPMQQGEFSLVNRATADHTRYTHYMEQIPLTYAGPLLFLLFLLAMVMIIIRDRRRTLGITSLWLWGSIIILNIFVPWGRYVMPALPAMAVVIGVGVSLIPWFQERRWSTPLAAGMWVLFSIQQTWVGPVLTFCHDQEQGYPTKRVFCSGMIRPVRLSVERPDLRGLTFREQDRMVLMAVIPTRLSPEPPPPPFGRTMAAFRQWLVTDTGRQIEGSPLHETRGFKDAHLDRLHLLILGIPGPAWKVPGEEHDMARRARAWVEKHPGRWRKVKTIDFPGISRMLVFQNRSPEPSPEIDPALIW